MGCCCGGCGSMSWGRRGGRRRAAEATVPGAPAPILPAEEVAALDCILVVDPKGGLIHRVQGHAAVIAPTVPPAAEGPDVEVQASCQQPRWLYGARRVGRRPAGVISAGVVIGARQRKTERHAAVLVHHDRRHEGVGARVDIVAARVPLIRQAETAQIGRVQLEPVGSGLPGVPARGRDYLGRQPQAVVSPDSLECPPVVGFDRGGAAQLGGIRHAGRSVINVAGVHGLPWKSRRSERVIHTHHLNVFIAAKVESTVADQKCAHPAGRGAKHVGRLRGNGPSPGCIWVMDRDG